MANITVKATRVGYYDHKRRREGEVFNIKKPEHMGSWMEKLSHGVSEASSEDSEDDQIAAPPVKRGRWAKKAESTDTNNVI